MKVILYFLIILLINSIVEEKFILPKQRQRIEFEMQEKENQNLLVQIDTFYSGREDQYLKARIFDKRNLFIPIQTFESGFTVTDAFHYIVEDVNFDGYDDFYYMSYRGNVNVNYFVWVWNPKKNRFEYAEELEKLMNFSVDKERQIIKSWSRNGANEYSQEYYKYLNGKLECIRSLETHYYIKRQDYLKIICKDWRNGKLETVIETEVPIDFMFAQEKETKRTEKLSQDEKEMEEKAEEFWNYFDDIDYPEKKW